MNDEQIKDMLSQDPFAKAESLTTMAALDDTPFSCTFDTYLRIAKEEGFVEVLTVPFVGHHECNETMILLWHPLGILLKVDSFGEYRNAADAVFNWRANEGAQHEGLRGGYSEKGFLGENLDMREGLRYHMRRLKRDGVFLTPWIERPFMWLLTYMEGRATPNNYKAINAARIALLPADVQAVINAR